MASKTEIYIALAVAFMLGMVCDWAIRPLVANAIANALN